MIRLRKLDRKNIKSIEIIRDFLLSQESKYLAPWSTSSREVSSYAQRILNNDDATFAIMKNRIVVGLVGYKYREKYFIPQFNRVHWIHYVIGEEHRGSGITVKAIEKLFDYIIDNTDIETIYAGVNSSNNASERVLMKLQFEKVGERSGTRVFMKYV